MKARSSALAIGLGILSTAFVLVGLVAPDVASPNDGRVSGLAFTGADVLGITIVGVAAIGVGGVPIYRSSLRRRSAA